MQMLRTISDMFCWSDLHQSSAPTQLRLNKSRFDCVQNSKKPALVLICWHHHLQLLKARDQAFELSLVGGAELAHQVCA